MRRPALFYGWYIVAAGMLLMAYDEGLLIYGFTAFVNPIAATFGWSYALISLAISLRGLESGALGPLVGMAVDRWPAKRLVLIGTIIFGLGLFCLSQVTNLAMFYIGISITALGSSLAFLLVPATLVARWFRKDIGKASGILALGSGIAGMLVPLLVKLIDTYGWQNILLVFAVGIWVLGIPLSFVFRSRPENYGLLPDGKPQGLESSGNLRASDSGAGVKETLKTRAFWYIGVASIFQMAAVSAVIVHLMPYLTSLGMERSTAGMMAMLFSLASLAARIPFGFLADIFKTKYVMAISIGLTSVGAFLFWLIDGGSFVLVLLFAIIFGFGTGGVWPLRPPIIREYFGTKNFGTIFGLSNVFLIFGTVVAPPLAGWMYDTLGVYGPIWLILSGVSMLGAIVILTVPPVSRKPKPIIS